MDPLMPIHYVTEGMSRTRFEFLWRHFHLDRQEVTMGELQEDCDKDEELVEISLERNIEVSERVQQEQEEGNTYDKISDESDADKSGSGEEERDVWFIKLKPFLDHIRSASIKLMWSRIKNKPIGEGFKWFILATSGDL